jgi:predicted nucleic acid-binding protein
MAQMVVVDSGILIANFLQEQLSPLSDALLKQWQANQIILCAPVLLRYEVVAVTRKAVYQGRISAADGPNTCDNLLAYPVRLYLDDNLLK